MHRLPKLESLQDLSRTFLLASTQPVRPLLVLTCTHHSCTPLFEIAKVHSLLSPKPHSPFKFVILRIPDPFGPENIVPVATQTGTKHLVARLERGNVTGHTGLQDSNLVGLTDHIDT